MKKIITAIAILFTSLVAFAQDDKEPLINRQIIFDLLNISAIVLVIYLISNFILQLIKQNFDYRLKTRIIEKETAENIIVQLIQPNKKDPGNTLMQWFFIMAAIGAGFLIIYFTRPFGLHSVAIMAFCIAAGLAGYYYFTRWSEK